MSIEGQGHFFTMYFTGLTVLYVLCFTRPRYQVSVYRTIGPLVFDWIFFILAGNKDNYKSLDVFEFGQNSATDFGVSCP